MTEHFICMLLLWSFINCLITFMQLCHRQHSTQVCVQCVLVEVAANSQTSFSSHEPVPYRAVRASTSRAVEHLRWRCWSHRRLHSVRGGGTSTQTTVSFALGFKEGNCSETQRLVSAKVMTWCSIIHYSSAINERTKEKMAIKKLHRPFQSEIFAKRAYRELRLLKHMKHENVSRIKPTAHFLFPLVGLCIQRPRLLFKPGDRAARCVHACLGTRRDAGLVSIVVFVLFVWVKPSGGDRWGIRWAEVVHLWEAPVSLQCISEALLCFDGFQAKFNKSNCFFICMYVTDHHIRRRCFHKAYFV